MARESDASLRRQELIEDGREAVQVAAAIREVLNTQCETTLQQMINHYRAEALNHDYLIGKLGELNGLHMLMDSLENKQRRAAIAAEKEYGNAS